MSCEGPEKRVAWNELPRDVLQTLGLLLDSRDQESARLACADWRVGISYGVTALRPRTVPHAGALAAPLGAPPTLGAFPNLKMLDLRRTSISPFQLKQLASLDNSIQMLQLTYLERMGRPHEYFDQLEALYKGLEDLARQFAIELELHINEAPYARSFMLSDCELARIVAAPKRLAITSLQVSTQMAYNISPDGLLALMGLQSLRHLELVTYSGGLDNGVFKQFSALTSLEHLHIGIMREVTGDGLAEGLGRCQVLRELTLVDCSSLQNRGVGQLARAVPQLASLALIKCPWLTDSAIRHLQPMQSLARLSLADNGNITGEGLNRLSTFGSLRNVEVRRMTHVGPEEVEALMAIDSIDSVNDRCKLVRKPQPRSRHVSEPSCALSA